MSAPHYGDIWQSADGDVRMMRTILGVEESSPGVDGDVLAQQQVAYGDGSGPYNSTERCPIDQWGEWMRGFVLVREEPRQ